jgi:hypothetical protein
MLDLEPRLEGRALLQYEFDGEDPEVVAAHWIDATMAEVRLVVHHALTIEPNLSGSEWLDDFVAAHKWLRRRQGRRCPAGCGEVVYNDGGAWFDPRTDKPHGCKGA